jgi:hypothetical protein
MAQCLKHHAHSLAGTSLALRPRVNHVLRLFAIVALSTTGCATHLSQGVVRADHTEYRIGPIPSNWSPVKLRDMDVTYVSNDSPHTIAINATCKDFEDAPLKVLTKHLLMGFTDRSVLEERTRPLDGRESLQTHIRAKLDGVPVELLTVVMKKNRCIYDITYVSPIGQYEQKLSAVESVLSSFQTGDSRS